MGNKRRRSSSSDVEWEGGAQSVRLCKMVLRFELHVWIAAVETLKSFVLLLAVKAAVLLIIQCCIIMAHMPYVRQNIIFPYDFVVVPSKGVIKHQKEHEQ